MSTLRAISVALAVFVLAGCASLEVQRNTSPDHLNRLEMGMPMREAARVMHATGELVFAFIQNAATYECVAVFVPKTGQIYYLLSKDEILIDALLGDKCLTLASTPSGRSADDILPHEDGFERLLAPFAESENPLETTDLHERKQGYSPGDYYGYPSEYLMWSPIMILNAPIAIPTAVVHEVAASRTHALKLGRTPDAIRHRTGAPRTVLGDPSRYGIWVVTTPTVGSQGDPTLASVGFRDGKSVWIRFHYDASVDGAHPDHDARAVSDAATDENTD